MSDMTYARFAYETEQCPDCGDGLCSDHEELRQSLIDAGNSPRQSCPPHLWENAKQDIVRGTRYTQRCRRCGKLR